MNASRCDRRTFSCDADLTLVVCGALTGEGALGSFRAWRLKSALSIARLEITSRKPSV